MRKILLIALLLMTVKGFAQITLEYPYTSNVYLSQVSANEWDYYTISYSIGQPDTISIYSINHSFVEYFVLPCPPSKRIFEFFNLSKNLFSTSGKFDIAYQEADTGFSYNNPVFNVIEDDGSNLLQVNNGEYDEVSNSSSGAKLLVAMVNNSGASVGTTVYSLPGNYAGIPPPGEARGNVNNAYPNPTTDVIHLPYNLNGTEQGQLIVTNIQGQIQKQFKVTNAFKDILLNANELPKGSYLYYLVTNGTQSPAKQFIVQ